jgi:putative sigma-54 modulation protein
MNIDIQCSALTTTDEAAVDHARRRLRFVMTRHSDRIQRIVVRLGDMRGTFGQHGMYCRIRVELLEAPCVESLDTGADLYDLIDRAVDRSGRAVLKHLRRAHVAMAEARSAAESRTSGLLAGVPHLPNPVAHDGCNRTVPSPPGSPPNCTAAPRIPRRRQPILHRLFG